MRCKITRSVISGLVIFTCAANAWATPAWTVNPGQSTIHFQGKSTLHQFEGQAHDFSGRLTTTAMQTELPSQGEIHIDVARLDTGIEKRDANMRAMFDAVNYPQINVKIKSIEFDETRTHALVKTVLLIKETPVDLAVTTDVIWENSGLRLKGKTRLSLKQSKLHAPSVALLVRVFDAVNVDFDIFFSRI